MIIIERRSCILAGAAGVAFLTAAGLLPAKQAAAQSAAEQLLKQVLPGSTQEGGDLTDAGERACERQAEDKGLEVRRVLDARQSGSNNLEVTLRVDDRGERYEAVCVYDGDDQEVRGLEPVRGSARDEGDELDERLADRARDACWDAAERRDLDEIDVDDIRARDRATVEVTMRVEDRGERLDLTCLYDDEERQAFLAD